MKVVATYNPAILTKDQTHFRTLRDHMALVRRVMEDADPAIAEPHIVEARDPTPDDPTLIAVDIETYGACSHDHNGKPIPPQRFFHPAKSALHDAPEALCLTAAVTLPKTTSFTSVSSSRSASQSSSSCSLRNPASLWPGVSMTFRLHVPAERAMFRRWLTHARVLLNQNIPFDAMYLRAEGYPIHEDHVLIDLMLLNYLDSEQRPERSLKSVGPLFGWFDYSEEQSLADGARFPSPDDPDLLRYNARDTHRTLIAASRFVSRIVADWPGSPKLEADCIHHYSEVLWNVIRMGESGVPISDSVLSDLERTHTALRKAALAEARSFGYTFSGKGSIKDTDRLFAEAEAVLPPAVVHKLDRQKSGSLSTNHLTTLAVAENLPDDFHATPAFQALLDFRKHDKLLGTYIRPLRGEGKPKDAPVGGILYPTWFALPSEYEGGAEGGTVQSRFSAKDPAIQTFPKEVKAAIRSRYKGGSILWCDLAQIELRVAALLSGDETLIDAFTQGYDLHTTRAESIWGSADLRSRYGDAYADDPAFRSLERQCAKHANFTDLNLGGAHTLQRTIKRKGGVNVPLEMCQHTVSQRPKSRPGLHAWQQTLIEQVVTQDHHVELPITGQSRRFPGPASLVRAKLSSTIVNFPIQATAANLFHHLQSWLRRNLPRAIHQCAQVHDSVVLDAPSHRVPHARAAFADAVAYQASCGYWARLQRIYGRTVPLDFDIEEVR